MKPVYARIVRAVPVGSGMAFYEAITESGRRQMICIKSGMILREGQSVRVQEHRGEWSLA